MIRMHVLLFWGIGVICMVIVAVIFALVIGRDPKGAEILYGLGATFLLHYVVIKVISKGRINYWDAF